MLSQKPRAASQETHRVLRIPLSPRPSLEVDRALEMQTHPMPVPPRPHRSAPAAAPPSHRLLHFGLLAGLHFAMPPGEPRRAWEAPFAQREVGQMQLTAP